jgi:hypothetical protein
MTQEQRAEARENRAAEAAEQNSSPQEQTAAALQQLQEENQQLRRRIDELAEQQAEGEGLTERLGEVERTNDELRRRYAAAALNEAIGRAAQAVGISHEAAAVYAHRFRCEVDTEGEARIEPNPTEFLLEELRDNPLLRDSAQRHRQHAEAGAVINGAIPAEQADPVQLMASLDRSPARKARFIARHGTQSYLDLAARARMKGYAAR